MIDQTKKIDIIERLGPLGNMVADLGSRLHYPISSPPELAKQFSETEKLEIGMESFGISEVCLQIPENLFPINSFDDLVGKLEKNQVKNFNPNDLKTFLHHSSMVGYTLKSRRKAETLKREGNQLGNKTGGPGKLPDLKAGHLKKPPDLKPVNKLHDDAIKKMGPLGGMILDLTDDLVFPVNDKLELARQFTYDEHILIGRAEYPIPELVSRIPDEFFPISSQQELTDKLVKLNFKEINPYNLRGLLEKSDNIGLLLEMDEKRLRNKIGNQVMYTGGPDDDIPNPSKTPESKDTLPLRADTGRKLGIIGDMIYDLGEQINFPVLTPAALAANFKEKDSLLLGPRQYSLSKLSLRVPESLFPINSFEELVEKLNKVGLKKVDFIQLKKFVESDSQLGYKINYKEEELKNLTRGSEMQSGGPEMPPPGYK